MTLAAHFRLGATASELSSDLDEARAEFELTRSLVCPEAISPDVFEGLVRLLGRSRFVSSTVEGLGHREIEAPEIAGTAICLLLNRAPVFRWLEAVTGCGKIVTVVGRVVQTRPVAGDRLRWHNDMAAEIRRLGVTVALDSPTYDGGEFEMRRVGGRAMLRRFKHDQPGTALVFEVRPQLEHRVLPLTAGGPRRVFTGWFIG
jgi:hypothetical protein